MYDNLPDAIVDDYTSKRETLHNYNKALRFLTNLFREKVEESAKPEKELHILTLNCLEDADEAAEKVRTLFVDKIVDAAAEMAREQRALARETPEARAAREAEEKARMEQYEAEAKARAAASPKKGGINAKLSSSSRSG